MSVLRDLLGLQTGTSDTFGGLRAVVAQFLLGAAGLAVTTFICLQMNFGVARTGFAYVILITLVSPLGSFAVSVVLSIAAAACLDYFFAPPSFKFGNNVPEDVERIVAFLTTSLVVTALTTKLKRAANALHEIQLKWDRAERIAHFGWWERDFITGRVSLSDEVSRIFGQQAVDLPGWHGRWLELIHQEDRAMAAEAAAAALRPGGPRYDLEYRVVRPDGTVRMVRSQGDVSWDRSGRPLRQFGVLHDITELRQAEAAVRRSAAYLAEAQRLSHTGTSAFDTSGNLYWSEECYRIWELDPRHGLPDARTVLQRVHPDDRDRVREQLRKDLQKQREQVLEFRIIGSDGAIKHIETTSHPLLSAMGDIVEVIATHVDVSERRRAQEQAERLRQLESDLAHMHRLGIMGELTASLAHEILHPIATARNNARAGMRLLDANPRDIGEVKEALASVVRDADRAREIVGRIRDHIKKVPPQSEIFDVNEAVEEVLAMVRNTIEKSSISVRTCLMERKACVRGDRVQLQQVTLNLILNAVEAMASVKEGARELSISTEPAEAGGTLVRVRDSGPGIEPEHVERIFEPFYTTKRSGIGMGLSICRSIIDAHGGRLWMDPNQSQGTVFQFTLPAADEILASISSTTHAAGEAPRFADESSVDYASQAKQPAVSD